MASHAFLACDWGTTNLRAWVATAAGEPLVEREFPFGVSRLAPGEAARLFDQEVRPAMQARELPAVLCGMIGSDLGWRAAGYRPCPATVSDLAAGMLTVEPGAAPVKIAPGLHCDGVTGAPDVMRGEETQVFGWLAEEAARRCDRHVICHPGTHAKWIIVEDGVLVRFVTAMTGELFALLRGHSVLKSDAPVADEAAFDAGLAAAGDGGALASRLFSARARVVAGGADAGSTPSYLSGLLVGAEIASAPALLGVAPGSPVVLLGDANLCRWYERALARLGYPAQIHDGERAALLGLAALHRAGDPP